MADRNPQREEVFQFSRKKRQSQLQTEDQQKARPASRACPSTLAPAWQSTALFSFCLLLLLTIALAFHTYVKAAYAEERLEETILQMQAELQELHATVRFDSTRRQVLLGMRDEILRVNSSISLGAAFKYAELLLTVTDKYPSVDPVLMLSIGIVESGFDTRAHSPADARGLYQIWPSTGRMLAVMLAWEYTDEMLFDSVCNTEMAALYLDILMTTYNDLGMALAEYNGGPINAGYYRANSRRTTAETKDYIPKVLSHYERLAQELPMAPGRSYDILYREPSRAGKQLDVTRQMATPRQAE